MDEGEADEVTQVRKEMGESVGEALKKWRREKRHSSMTVVSLGEVKRQKKKRKMTKVGCGVDVLDEVGAHYL